MNSLLRRLNVRPGEERMTLLLLAEILLLGIGFNFLETSAFPLFLVEFSAQTLPTIYIINAVVVALITWAYLRVGQRTTFGRQLIISLAFLVALVAAFWLALSAGGGRRVVFALPILFQIVVTLGPLGFWSLSNRLLTLRQSKRLIGLIGSGLWVSIVVTGLLMPGIVRWAGTVNLLLLSSLGLAAALGLLVIIVRDYGAALVATNPAGTGADRARRSMKSLVRSRYVTLMFALTIVSWLAFYFVDNIFYNRVGAQFPSESQLSAFLGLYLAILGLFTLFNNFVLTGFVITRFGVRAGLLVLPVSLLIVTLAIAVIGTGWGIVPILFWLATLNKVLDLGLAFSVDQSAQTILYQALPAAERTHIQTIDTGIVRMVAVGLAGVLLFLLNQVLDFNVVQLTYVLLPIVVAWLVGVFLTGRAYPKELIHALERRRLTGLTLTLDDAETVDIVRSTLENPQPGPALVALNLLVENDPASAAIYVQKALQHPAPPVRLEALDRVDGQGLAELSNEVLAMAAGDPDIRVRAVALSTAAAIAGPAARSLLIDSLNDPDVELRQAAITGLIQFGDGSGNLAAQTALMRLGQSPAVEDRLMAARTMQLAGKSEPSVLLPLLTDADKEVRRAALRAAGTLPSSDAWPVLLAALDDPATTEMAAAALDSAGVHAVNDVSEAWSRQEAPATRLVILARIIGHSDMPGAQELLLQRLDDPSDTVRMAVLKALQETNYRASDAPAHALLTRQIAAEVDHAAWLMAAERDCATLPELDYLEDVMHTQVQRSRDRVLLLLSFQYDPDSIGQVIDNIASETEERRAYALEILDILLPSETKALVMPLMEGLTPEACLQRLGPRYAQPVLDAPDRVQALFAGNGRTDRWMTIAAIYAIGQLQCGTPAIEDVLGRETQATDPIVSETAFNTLAKLKQPELESPSSGERPMLSTIEKMFLLKEVELFADMPDELLAEVASLVTEVELAIGQPVFVKGDHGESLYVILDGEVRVHDGPQTINYLGAGEVFGEMALLDAEPRMASVTPTAETVLLKLDQEPFFDLMESRSEVARGIIRVLSARLRGRVQEVTQLRLENEPVSPQS